MDLPKRCELKCESITHGSFSGERVCCFSAYDGKKITQAYPSAPKKYVNERLKTVQVDAISNEGNKIRIRFPMGGSGDFDYFIVPSDGLAGLV
ncbi:MAG: hypothetical protein Q8N63_00085 [Nanoarchaeota archaeon]|nr:hypothetical protein [Nanoarchaeota archaeon]